MIDLEHLPRYDDGFYLFRYNLDNWDYNTIKQMFYNLKAILRVNDIDTPLIAIPEDVMLTVASKEELLQIRDIIDKAVSDIKN